MEKPKIPVSATEEDQVTRKLLIWLNSYPDLPVDMIRFEFLAADTEGMALSTIQAGYITRQYILGGYQAELQFKIIYRLKPGNSNDKRLKADEILIVVGHNKETLMDSIGSSYNGIPIKYVEQVPQLGIAHGIMKAAPALEAGMQEGDIIEKVNDVTYDLEIIVDGFKFTISEYGIVTGEKTEIATLPENKPNIEAGTPVKIPDSWQTETVSYIKTSDGTKVKTLENSKLS